MPGGPTGGYPATVKTAAQRALYNNLGKDEALAMKVDAAIQTNRQDGWRDNALKTRKVRQAIRLALSPTVPPDLGVKAQRSGDSTLPLDLETETDRILTIAQHQHEY